VVKRKKEKEKQFDLFVYRKKNPRKIALDLLKEEGEGKEQVLSSS
jgi:hypothetical protein